jgi:hypothetical protein
MPPGCHENFTAKGEVPEMLHLGRVPGSKWLFSEWDVAKDKETIWVAITTALQRHLPGKFKSPDELRARLSTYVLSSLSHEDFYICFPCCEGVRSDIASYADYLARPCPSKWDPSDVPTIGDIHVFVRYLRHSTRFIGAVYTFSAKRGVVTEIEKDSVTVVAESVIDMKDIVLVHLFANRWRCAETRIGTTQLW